MPTSTPISAQASSAGTPALGRSTHACNTFNVYSGDEARRLLMLGVDKVADAVKPTLGAKGSNAVLMEDTYPYHIVTNDGISIAQKIVASHPAVQIGVNIMKEIADRANKESGDGTTTAMTLTQAILREGMAQGARGMETKRSLDACLPLIESSLDKQKKEITVFEVGAVATVSAEDKELGQMLEAMYVEIGKDGIVELDVSGTFETKWEVKEGVRLRNAGYIAPYMATEGIRAVLLKPRILITKQRVATLADIDPLFAELSKDGTNEVVMFVDDIDASVLQALAFTHQKGIFKATIIKAPILWKDWLYSDFAAITGATIIEPLSGVSLKDARASHLGTCDKLVVTRDETTVIGIRDIAEHVHKIDDGSDESKIRLAWLKTKAAVLRLGASSESELSYKRLKAEDARNASWLALQEGIVPGGGVALFNASCEMPDTPGGRILRNALKAPLEQIALNAEVEPSVVTSSISVPFNTRGLDAVSGDIVDMWDAKIVDPARVVKNSVRNAISVAGVVLTTEVITFNEKKP